MQNPLTNAREYGIIVSEKGKEITFGDLDEDIVLCHAGTKLKDGKLVTDGGRVLGVCAKGESIEEARKKYLELNVCDYYNVFVLGEIK